MGYELAFDMADASGSSRLELPDVIFYPTGGGTGLIGMWKAFDEMQRLGWIGEERPRMVVVQAENCCPIVRAFEQNQDHAEMFPNASTKAAGLRVPAAIGDFLMLRALRESHGTALTVTDEEMIESAKLMGSTTGIFPAPEGGACLAALVKLLEDKWVAPDESVVLFNTGTGLKYAHLFT